LKKINRGKNAKLNYIYKQLYLLLSRLNIEFEFMILNLSFNYLFNKDYIIKIMNILYGSQNGMNELKEEENKEQVVSVEYLTEVLSNVKGEMEEISIIILI